MGASTHSYVIAMGSNMRVPKVGGPRRVLAAAAEILEDRNIALLEMSRVISSAPVGPSQRRYANAAALVETTLAPDCMLRELQSVEREFGRKKAGARWRARQLDLDIILWSGGMWLSPGLMIPHPHFRRRSFVLGPAEEVAPRWRDPVSGLTIRQIAGRGA